MNFFDDTVKELLTTYPPLGATLPPVMQACSWTGCFSRVLRSVAPHAPTGRLVQGCTLPSASPRLTTPVVQALVSPTLAAGWPFPQPSIPGLCPSTPGLCCSTCPSTPGLCCQGIAGLPLVCFACHVTQTESCQR